MKFELPQLNYNYDSLEPYIDAQTMEIHYTKHHQGYIDKLNLALENHSDLQTKTLEELITNLDSLPDSIKETVRNNGGGHFNHSFFWSILKINNGLKPTGQLLEMIESSFDSFDSFKDKFTQAALGVFGSGWTWLVINNKKELEIITTVNQNNPLSLGSSPILGIDVWEHAYYLKYKNKRADYLEAFWNIIDWAKVQKKIQ